MPKKLTTAEFIIRAQECHAELYNYNYVEYKSRRLKVKIICKTHGAFLQTPNNHLSGKGCLSCYNDSRRMSLKQFITESQKVHGTDTFDYSKLKYVNSRNKVTIFCKIHGKFAQRPDVHLAGSTCPGCANLNRTGRTSDVTTSDFINRANKVHNNKYSYSVASYHRANTKLEIICNIHGSFFQTPNNHLSRKGCPKCNSSHGEIKIGRFLSEANIDFEEQYKTNKCRRKRELPFDFYIPSHNIMIEYDGEQHYKPVKYFGGVDGLKYRKENDGIKSKYCRDNNISLIRISYKDFNDIEKILKKRLITLSKPSSET